MVQYRDQLVETCGVPNPTIPIANLQDDMNWASHNSYSTSLAAVSLALRCPIPYLFEHQQKTRGIVSNYNFL